MKMRFAFILALLYFSSSMGAALHLHYCPEEVCISSMQEKEDLCKEEAVQLSSLYTVVSPAGLAFQPDRAVASVSACAYTDDLSGNIRPISDKIPLFIRHCNFRI